MSVKSIWSKVPPSVREPSKELGKESVQQNNEHRAVPAGEKCKHKKWQPEVVETVRAKKWTCYDCVFVCSKCGLNTVGICDSYDCS